MKVKRSLSASTFCYRNFPQVEVLCKMIEELIEKKESAKVKIFAVSTGQEAITLATYLDYLGFLDFVSIEASDLQRKNVEVASKFMVDKRDYYKSPLFIRSEYYRKCGVGRGYLVNKVSNKIKFYTEDVFHPFPGIYDVVICQNLIVHLSHQEARVVLNNLVSLMSCNSILAVGGGEPEFIHNVLLKKGLQPVMEDVEKIHEAWLLQRSAWSKHPRPYWALEPFDGNSPEKFASIYKKED